MGKMAAEKKELMAELGQCRESMLEMRERNAAMRDDMQAAMDSQAQVKGELRASEEELKALRVALIEMQERLRRANMPPVPVGVAESEVDSTLKAVVVALQGLRIQLGFVDMAFSRSPDKNVEQDMITVKGILETLTTQAEQFAHRTLDLSAVEALAHTHAGDPIAQVAVETVSNLQNLWMQMELIRNHVLWWGWWIVRLHEDRHRLPSNSPQEIPTQQQYEPGWGGQVPYAPPGVRWG